MVFGPVNEKPAITSSHLQAVNERNRQNGFAVPRTGQSSLWIR